MTSCKGSAAVTQEDNLVETYHFFQRKLTALSNYLAIDTDHRAAVVVKPVSVTAFLIGIKIDSSTLHPARQLFIPILKNRRSNLLSSHGNKFDPVMKLPQLMVAPGGVREDLDAIQSHTNMWATCHTDTF